MTSDEIRENVEDSRGLLKKIQLVVPGFRGYRQLEDIRSADELLRSQVADMLAKGEQSLMGVRKMLVEGGNYSVLERIGSSLSQLQQLEGEVRHSMQGYSGISPAIRVGSDTLDGLYEYDYAFVDSVSRLIELCGRISGNDDIVPKLEALDSAINKFRDSWERRIEAVEKIKV